MKKLFSLLLILALALSLAACGGSEAPAGGEAPAQQPAANRPAGTWTLSESGDPEYAPGQITLLLDEDGFGYQAITDFSDDYAYQDYLELRWSEGSIILDGVGGVYLLQGDSLTEAARNAICAGAFASTAETTIHPLMSWTELKKLRDSEVYLT